MLYGRPPAVIKSHVSDTALKQTSKNEHTCHIQLRQKDVELQTNGCVEHDTGG